MKGQRHPLNRPRGPRVGEQLFPEQGAGPVTSRKEADITQANPTKANHGPPWGDWSPCCSQSQPHGRSLSPSQLTDLHRFEGLRSTHVQSAPLQVPFFHLFLHDLVLNPPFPSLQTLSYKNNLSFVFSFKAFLLPRINYNALRRVWDYHFSPFKYFTSINGVQNKNHELFLVDIKVDM